MSRSGREPWLRRRNPLAKLAAVMPAIAWVFLSERPAVSIGCGAAAAVLLLSGLRPPIGRVALALLGIPLGIAVLSLLFALWLDPARAANGSWTDGVVLLPGVFGPVALSGVLSGAETAGRIAAIALLSLLGGAGTSRTQLSDALMQNTRLPYRIGYTAYAATGYPARLAAQRRIIRDAQRVRGGGRRGPAAALARELHGAVALLVDALRHAERMSLAIESRGFGLYERRTWRRFTPWRRADTAYLAAFVLGTAAAAIASGLLPGGR